MIKLHSLLFLCAPLLFSLLSCTKELSYETPTGIGLDSVNFYAVIDGVPWRADSLAQVSISDSGVLSITGIGKSQEVISMILPIFQQGVFAVNSQTQGYALYSNLKDSLSSLFLSSASSDPSKAGGKITITEIDSINHSISGTFQFNLYDPGSATSKSITAGFFNKLPYAGGSPINPGGPSGGGTTGDFMKATIDGTDWTAAGVVGASNSGELSITGASADGNILVSLEMLASAPPGAYTLDVNGGVYWGLYSANQADGLVSQSGTLTITQNDAANKHVEGTFDFQAKSLTSSASSSITNGSFSVTYQ